MIGNSLHFISLEDGSSMVSIQKKHGTIDFEASLNFNEVHWSKFKFLLKSSTPKTNTIPIITNIFQYHSSFYIFLFADDRRSERAFKKLERAAINSIKLKGLRNLKSDVDNVLSWFMDSSPEVACKLQFSSCVDHKQNCKFFLHMEPVRHNGAWIFNSWIPQYYRMIHVATVRIDHCFC